MSPLNALGVFLAKAVRTVGWAGARDVLDVRLSGAEAEYLVDVVDVDGALGRVLSMPEDKTKTMAATELYGWLGRWAGLEE